MDSRAARRFVTSRHLLPRQQVAFPSVARVDLVVFSLLYLVGFGEAVLWALDGFLDFRGYPNSVFGQIARGVYGNLPLISTNPFTQLLAYEAAGPVAAGLMLAWLITARHLPVNQLGVSRPPRGRWRRSHSGGMIAVAAVYWPTTAICLNLLGLLIVLGYGAGDDYEPGLIEALLVGPLSALAAGVGEEVLLVAALTVVAERAGWSTARLYLVAVVLRIAFHVYYGYAVLVLIPWALVAVWLFRRTRTVLPLVLCHALWNTAVTWPAPLGTLLYWGVPIVGTVLLARAWGRRPVAVRST